MSNKLILAMSLTLYGCGVDDVSVTETVVDNCPDIIVTGQSNAKFSWHYFEENSGLSVVNISENGYSIEQLIDDYEPVCTDNLIGIVLVHGESDAVWGTDPVKYIDDVESYRLMVADVPLYVSSVGYTTNHAEDYMFDGIRYYQENSGYSDWIVAYDKAHTFRDRGMLIDSIHFAWSGQVEMMDSIIDSINKSK